MPRIHLGVYLTSGQETSNAVLWALEVFIPYSFFHLTAKIFPIGRLPGVRQTFCMASVGILINIVTIAALTQLKCTVTRKKLDRPSSGF